MRKFMTVCLWLGLIGCALLLMSLSSQRNALIREKAEALRRGDALQTLYDQAKEELETQTQAWAAEKAELEAAHAETQQELSRVTAQLQASRQEAQALAQAEADSAAAAETMRREMNEKITTLSQDKDAVEKRLKDVLSILSPRLEEEGMLPALAPEEEAEPAAEDVPVG